MNCNPDSQFLGNLSERFSIPLIEFFQKIMNIPGIWSTTWNFHIKQNTEIYSRWFPSHVHFLPSYTHRNLTSWLRNIRNDAVLRLARSDIEILSIVCGILKVTSKVKCQASVPPSGFRRRNVWTRSSVISFKPSHESLTTIRIESIRSLNYAESIKSSGVAYMTSSMYLPP
jgi:hypothetical protein